MACCVTPASAELAGGPRCSAGFGPGTKPKIARLGLCYPRALNIRICRTSRVLVSCSTTGFCRKTNGPHAADGASLPHGYCPCCFVLCVFTFLGFPNTFSASRMIFFFLKIYKNPNTKMRKGGNAAVSSWFNPCSRNYGRRFIRHLFCATQAAFTPRKSPLDSSPLL